MWNSLVVDTTFVKNVYGKDVVGRNPTDRGRFKVSLLTDSQGTPLCSVFHKANNSQTLKHLLETANRKTNILRNYTPKVRFKIKFYLLYYGGG